MWEFLKQIRPVWWPHPGQRDFLLSRDPYRALACGRRWGKTDVCAAEVAYRLHRGEKGRTLLVAPTLDQARLLFDRVLDLLVDVNERWPDRFPMPRLRNSPFPCLDLNGHRVLARSAGRARSLRGMGADHLIVDEAAFLPSGILGEVLFPMLATSGKGTATLISTPSGFGEFQRFFERGKQGVKRHWSRSAPSSENPRVSRNFIAEQRDILNEATFAREYEGRFAGIENGLFAFETVRAAVAPVTERAGNGPFVAGLDLARTRDWTALVVLEGTRESVKTVLVDRWRGLGWERQLMKVQAILQAFPGVVLRLDQTGLGDPVLDWARRLMPNVTMDGVIFTPEIKRSVMGGLTYLLESSRLRLPDHRQLVDELLAFIERPSGRIEGSGSHDDLVCALALAASALNGTSGLIRLGNRRE